MKGKIRFFVKLGIMLSLVLGFILGVIMPRYQYVFNASIIDKVARITSLEGPKLVLIGNSNLAFGMNSAKLEEAIGMQVVNMGLHGGLGNAFHEEMAKLNVCEGDIYIICHTSYSDSDVIADPTMAWLTVENHPQLWKLIRPKDYWDMVEGFPAYFKKAVLAWANGEGRKSYPTHSYDRGVFNEYGDDAFPRKESKGNIDFSSQKVPAINDVCINRLNELNAYLTARGAFMAVAAYPVANGEFSPTEEEWDAFQIQLESALDCPVISQFKDYRLDYSYFFDTVHHLIDAGVEIRTNLLIEDIQHWMDLDPRVGKYSSR